MYNNKRRISEMKNNKQYGAVSLFVVVFAALLITVVTVSFIRNMTVDQQQATVVDLSQSAYDSAQVGVEDAKRALLKYQTVCNPANNTASLCASTKIKMNSATCNDSVSVLGDLDSSSASEIKVKTNGDANALDQAYTCVTTTLDTDDFVGTLTQDASKMIPLVGASDFNSIKIEWFSTSKDLVPTSAGPATQVDLSMASSNPQLLSQANWSTAAAPNRPSIIRTQLIQFNNSGFSLSDFDTNTNGSVNDSLFLYPTSTVTSSPKVFTPYDPRNPISTKTNMINTTCNPSLTVTYSCSATISLPSTIQAGSHNAFLNLMSIYKKANFRVQLLSGSTVVKFKEVQPEVDSTGRANDLFRRVKSRVELTDINFPYPDMAVDVTGNLCKDFRITDSSVDYQNYCTP